MDIMFYSDKSIYIIMEIIKSHIKASQNEEPLVRHYEENQFEYISCSSYDISIENSDLHDVNLKFIEESFGVNANYCIGINVLTATYERGFAKSAELIKQMLHSFPTDFIVFDDSSKLVYRRIGNDVISDDNFWKGFL